MNPPEAADPARFAAPPGSHRGETQGKPASGPDWAAMDRVAGGLDALIRHAPHLPGHGAAGEQPEAMPLPDPAPLELADASPPPDEVLDLLYRSGEPRDLGADRAEVARPGRHGRPVPESLRAAGRGGFADLLDAMTRGMNVARTEARLRVSGPDRYRLDFRASPGPRAPTTIACDGERRWRVFQDRTMVGPAAAADGHYRVPGRLVLAAPRPAVRRHGAHLPRPSRPPAPRDPRPRRRGVVVGPLLFPDASPTRSWTPRPAACSA